jgi:hypothetical protein
MTSGPTPLPPAVQQMIDATNGADAAAFVAAFTEDGVVDDWGRTFTGRGKIAAWNDGENMGVGASFRVESAVTDGDTCTVRVHVSGQGFNGASTFTFTMADGLIRRMQITG